MLTWGQYLPAVQLSQRTLPAHETQEPNGHCFAVHIPLSGQ